MPITDKAVLPIWLRLIWICYTGFPKNNRERQQVYTQSYEAFSYRLSSSKDEYVHSFVPLTLSRAKNRFRSAEMGVNLTLILQVLHLTYFATLHTCAKSEYNV